MSLKTRINNRVVSMARQWLAASALAVMLIVGQSQPSKAAAKADGLYGYTMQDIDGKDVSLSKYRGKVVVVVNVASKCGLTPHYKGLQAMYEKHAKDGLVVLGFPANNFRGQEPGSNEQIKAFCSEKYNVTFDMFSKISVKGNDKHPFYQWLTAGAGDTAQKGEIRWNFEKFVFGRDGKLIARFHPKTKPSDDKFVAAVATGLKAGSTKGTAAKTPAVLNFNVKSIDGKDTHLGQFAGKVVMFVNVASKCGATPQYRDLQALHEKYSKKGLVIIGFPANNFGSQEPGSNKEIKAFCTDKYNVAFPMMAKISVAGKDKHPLYQFLTSKKTNPDHGGDVSWNFEKFVVSRSGQVIGRFKTRVNPQAKPVTKLIEAELKKPAPGEKKKEVTEAVPKKLPPALKTYMGRRVAFTMHWMAADWLTRNEREREEATSVMIKQLGLKPGMTVGDVGCGNGYHTLMMAKLVGEKGTVYGVDIQPQMLAFLKKRAKGHRVSNVKPVLGTLVNPNLPPNSCDAILLVDAYHEFSHPVHMLSGLRKALKPNGRLVLVEYRAEDPDVPIKPDHKMSKKQVIKEMTANGFRLADSFDKLPWQHMLSFERIAEKN